MVISKGEKADVIGLLASRVEAGGGDLRAEFIANFNGFRGRLN